MKQFVLVFAAIISIGACHEGVEPERATAGIDRADRAMDTEIGAIPSQLTLFESGQVRPLALSPDGKYLYAVNTPDGRLEIFRIGNGVSTPLQHIASVQVGLEPVAVAVRNRDEVWVVNHLSDSVSIVDVRNPRTSRVVRTLLVGDEPRDIVFAGPEGSRAFITTAHRGQNHPLDPRLSTPGIGRADVWVFDAGDPGDSMGGDPLTIVTLFADTPRALAVSPDGMTVYAAAFLSGNRTTVVHDTVITNGFDDAPDGMGVPGPSTNFQGIPQPETSLIVKFDGAHWVDELGRIWDDQVKFDLPDKDVFAIDASADPPVQKAGEAGFYTGVGTILFNMVVNPINGKVYVTNTEARNHVRFGGPATFAGSTVQGHTHDTRITVLDGSGGVHPRDINKHVDRGQCCAPVPNPESETSLALPLDMAVTSDGATLYVAAFGSSKVGVFDTAALEDDSFVPDAASHIEVSGGGPSGLVLDEARGRIYVLTRFDNAISVIDAAARQETHHLPLFNPEPESVVAGRRFLYDARSTSSHGDIACGSCHVFGDLDALAWDLGEPDSEPLANPGPFAAGPFVPGFEDFQPMKGPMTTQSLRGLANHGPMHWRGDRTGANDLPFSAQPDTGLFDELAAFLKFDEAFVQLNGRHAPISEQDMHAFAAFTLQMVYPPNPIRRLDNSLTPSQERGREHFVEREASTSIPNGEIMACVTCHVLDPRGNAEFGVARPGFFGTDGRGLVEGDDLFGDSLDQQHFKVPHLRNMYQKVGMFGSPAIEGVSPHNDTSHQGDQIRGFGFLHDGSVDTMFRFHLILGFSDLFAPEGFPPGPEGDPLRRDVEAFLLAFDTNLAPIVGQQITLTADNEAAVSGRIDLMIERASGDEPECELMVTTRKGKMEWGYLYIPRTGRFVPSKHGAPALTDAGLRALAHKRPLTYTCVPPGSGYRMALDADLDGCFNVSELEGGADPRDASSTPPGC